MRPNLRNRIVAFEIADGDLVRTVISSDGSKHYVHRCSLKVFEIVAHVFDETPADGAGTAAPDIARTENLPFTQVDVAVGLLRDRGIIERRHKRNYPASECVHLDAMTEWHAMRHASATPREEVSGS